MKNTRRHDGCWFVFADEKAQLELDSEAKEAPCSKNPTKPKHKGGRSKAERWSHHDLDSIFCRKWSVQTSNMQEATYESNVWYIIDISILHLFIREGCKWSPSEKIKQKSSTRGTELLEPSIIDRDKPNPGNRWRQERRWMKGDILLEWQSLRAIQPQIVSVQSNVS